MGLSVLDNGRTALTSAERALGVAANNIANSNTKGFQPQQANFEESAPAGNGVSLSTSARALSAADGNGNNANLSVDVTNSLVYKAQFNAAVAVVKTADSTLGSLIDTKA